MSKGYRYSDEFKQVAVNQVTVHGYVVVDVASRLGISDKTLYNWIKIFSKPANKGLEDIDLQAEIARLKRELKRVEQERNILKEAAVDSSHQRNIHLDLAKAGIKCGCDRTLRLMRLAQICAQRGYKKPKGYYSGKPDITAPNTLN